MTTAGNEDNMVLTPFILKKDGSISIIAMTCFALIGDRGCLLAAGCNTYIGKPVSQETVIAQIRATIEGFR